MHTVTTAEETRPAYGTVEYYASLIRSNAVHHMNGIALYLIEDLANHPIHDENDAGRLDRIRNILAAVKLVAAEVEAQP